MNSADIIEISDLELNNKMDSMFVNKGPSKSTNFGSGIELLMNDRVKEGNGSHTSDIELEDLNNLENELNNLSEEIGGSSYKPRSDLFSSRSGSNMNDDFSDEKHTVKFADDASSIGKSTSETENPSKTWDGYGKFNNIPLNPDKHISSQPQLTKEELLREKFKYLRKLEGLEKKGVDISKKYTMDSPLAEMQGEYETIMDEKAKQNSVKFQGNMMMAIINGIEFLNGKFDPFDIKLDGWSEQINENITDYDDIFAELFEKYKSRATMAPELKLLFQLGGSAMMVHMTNTMFKSAMPGMDDILRQNPDLMRSFQTAAVNSMSQSSPGLSGFMNSMMNDQIPGGAGPPPPMATQGPNQVPPPHYRPGNNNSMRQQPPPNFNMGRSSFVDDGINIRENMSRNSAPSTRPDMKGPSDISDILSGLKTKNINIQEPQQKTNNDSTISISDLKDLQGDGNMPKKSRRRQKSATNSISLDI